MAKKKTKTKAKVKKKVKKEKKLKLGTFKETARDNQDGYGLLNALGFPFREE